MSRRSIIVMLDADLVADIDARAEALTANGRPTGRDDLIAAAVRAHLDAAEAKVQREPPSQRPAAIEAVARGVPESLAAIRRDARDALSRGRRRSDELVGRLRAAATAGDAAAWGETVARLPDELVSTRTQVIDAFDRTSATARQAASVLAGAVPALAPDAKARWLSAQAGARRPPDLILSAGRALEAAQAARTGLAPAVRELGESLAHAREIMVAHSEGAAPRPRDYEVDADLDRATWSLTATQLADEARAALASQLQVLEVGFEHGDKLAVQHLELILAIAREVQAHLTGVPDVASACA